MIYKMVALSEANGFLRLRTRGTFGRVYLCLHSVIWQK